MIGIGISPAFGSFAPTASVVAPVDPIIALNPALWLPASTQQFDFAPLSFTGSHNLTTWDGSTRWIYDTENTFAGGDVGKNLYVTGNGWETGFYQIQQLMGYSTADGQQNMVLLDRQPVMGAARRVTGGAGQFFTSSAQIVCDGNSLTVGQGALPTLSYPSQLAGMLGYGIDVLNFGVGLQTTLNMSADAATQIDPVYDATKDLNLLVAWEITNDLYFGASAQDAYDHYVAYCQARRAAGFTVVAVSVLPHFLDGDAPDYDARRVAVNALLAANWSIFADAYADLSTDARLTDAFDQTYFNPDHVHLTAAGYTAVAETVAKTILTHFSSAASAGNLAASVGSKIGSNYALQVASLKRPLLTARGLSFDDNDELVLNEAVNAAEVWTVQRDTTEGDAIVVRNTAPVVVSGVAPSNKIVSDYLAFTGPLSTENASDLSAHLMQLRGATEFKTVHASASIILDAAPLLWLDGSRNVYSDIYSSEASLEGQLVAVWPDRSGNGRDATATPTVERPARVDGGVSLDGVDDLLRFTRLANIRTVMMVFSGNGSGIRCLLGDSSRYDFTGGDDSSQFLFDPLYTPALAAARVDGVETDPHAIVRSNATRLLTLTTSADCAATSLASDRGSEGRNWQGVYKQVLLFDYVLSAEQIAQIEGAITAIADGIVVV